MHKADKRFNLVILAQIDFINSIKELKDIFKFNICSPQESKEDDIIMVHENMLNNLEVKNFLEKSNHIKVLVSESAKSSKKSFNSLVKIPISINELNKSLLELKSKYNFNKNSSILINGYTLDKNQKILKKGDKDVLLTEKEIKLLELLTTSSKPVSKNLIQSNVWEYSEDTDTHTVETHIYRLRKKMLKSFNDDNFISFDKQGYFLN